MRRIGTNKNLANKIK